MSFVDEFLEHYGVKGMQWGVRRRRSASEEKVRSKRKKLVNKRRLLSDDDIKKHIDRISSEKKLKELIDQDLNPGKTVAKRIVSESGQKVARTVLSGAALYAVKVAVDKKFNAGEAASFIAPKPKK